jgi:hypothetical protein
MQYFKHWDAALKKSELDLLLDEVNLIVSNTDEDKRDGQTRVEGNRLIVSNTDELDGGHENGGFRVQYR